MAPIPITVYHAMDSLCSYMLRYTIAIRGAGKNGIELQVKEELVDIHYKREHLSEFFLLKVNPKGQVPVLTSPSLESPMPDSLAITNYLATMFPQLKPTGHEADIDQMLEQIHAQPYFVLSFGQHNAAPIPKGTADAMQQILQRDDLSTQYRQALETKLQGASKVDFDAVLGPASVEKAGRTIRGFFDRVEASLPSSTGWLFGLLHPTAADAHLVALLVRLQDVGRDYLFPERVKQYAENAKATPEWQRVMGELGTTMCPG